MFDFQNAPGGLAPRPLLFLFAAAVGLFVPLFITRGIGPLDFWWWMTANALILCGLALVLDRSYIPFLRADLAFYPGQKILLGLATAVVLYLVFFVGNIAARLILPFAAGELAGIYDLKTAAHPLRITLLLVLIIGPGEEIFWRGALQRSLGAKIGPLWGFLITTAVYTLIHAGSFNFMLLVAAAVCGGVWGILYWKFRSVLLNVVSHTVWDVLVFLILPFSG